MYGDETTIRDLCVNVKQLTAARIVAAARYADALIDAMLAEAFYWPDDPQGVAIAPVPALVREVANLLTAARLESTAFAQNEAGGISANPYARSLKADGEKTLKQLISGEIQLPTLIRIAEVGRSDGPQPDTYMPVSSQIGGGSRHGRRRFGE